MFLLNINNKLLESNLNLLDKFDICSFHSSSNHGRASSNQFIVSTQEKNETITSNESYHYNIISLAVACNLQIQKKDSKIP